MTRFHFNRTTYNYKVGTVGFEPTTSDVSDRHSYQTELRTHKFTTREYYTLHHTTLWSIHHKGLKSFELSQPILYNNGPDRTRTRHPRSANAMLSQMSYWPKFTTYALCGGRTHTSCWKLRLKRSVFANFTKRAFQMTTHSPYTGRNLSIILRVIPT